MEKVKTAFNKETGEWEIGWPGRVSRYDVVYLTPPLDPMEGMPVGNGDVGALCWCEGSRVIFAVNKCDLWDDAKFGRFRNWAAEEEERSTTLRHGCRIIIDFKMPVFDLFYLSDFNGRISIADARIEMNAEGPLGSIHLNAFLGYDDSVLSCHVKSALKENTELEILVERYGSRTFSHWYRQIRRDASIGLSGTSSHSDENGAYITQVISSGIFAAGIRISWCNVQEPGNSVRYSVVHSHCSKAAICSCGSNSWHGSNGSKPRNDIKEFTLFCAVTGPMETKEHALLAIHNKLGYAAGKGMKALYENHGESWKKFWLRSLMECGDEYLDNIWHLAMYYARSSQGGKYPGRFISGLWSWARDTQQWNFYFHWNQQQIYWPLNSAGHHELIEPYLEYRFNSLPHAKHDAREIFNSDGAFVSDVCERRGYNSRAELLNHTPVAQVAMDFWRQYQYTGDADFLNKRVIPYIYEAACFFESLFEKGEDGKYHAREGTGYEGWIRLRDCISELVYGKVLFLCAVCAFKEAGIEEPRTNVWKEIAENLADLPVIEADKKCIDAENGCFKLKRGQYKGDAAMGNAMGNKVLAAGHGIEEGRMLTSKIPRDGENNPEMAICDTMTMINMMEKKNAGYIIDYQDMAVYDGIFPSVELSAIFPSGLVGLSRQGSELFNAASNTVKLYAAPGIPGWDPTPIAMARLGLREELRSMLRSWTGRKQNYCNGFGQNEVGYPRIDQRLKFCVNRVHDAAHDAVYDASLPPSDRKSNSFPFPAWPFRHMEMEWASVLSCAINESLLQSHDGVIRVAPAFFNDEGRFTLHAAGGFIVSAELREGKPLWVAIRSILGKKCRIENPWEVAFLYRNGYPSGIFGDTTIVFETAAGDIHLLVPDKKLLDQWETVRIECERNEAPRTSHDGLAMLGLPRMF